MTAKIVPPFHEESAKAKVQMAEDLWNTRDPERVVLAYTLHRRFGMA
jgi:nuclear transport factor 2 (NTF2) superfamily protein